MRRRCHVHKIELRQQRTRYGTRWQCPEPGCTVACWDGSTSTPADDESRAERHRLHKLFDDLWLWSETSPFAVEGGPNDRRSLRARAYDWLAKQMGIPVQQTHFGYFDMDKCREARQHIEALKPGAAAEVNQ